MTALRILLALAAVLVAAPARAHPHIWVTMHSELVYAPDGSVTGIRQHWAFDDMFSAFATQGLEAKDKGVFSRAELAPLAKTNVELLKEYDYFTFATADGNKAPLGDPLPDYFADYKDSVVTLHFTLPFKTPVKAKLLKIDIYDATIFVDFSFAKDKPVVACRRAGRLQARRGAAARDDLGGRQGAERHPRRPAQHADGLGRAIRQQDPGELSLRQRRHDAALRAAYYAARWPWSALSTRRWRSPSASRVRRPKPAASPAGFWPSRRASTACCRG